MLADWFSVSVSAKLKLAAVFSFATRYNCFLCTSGMFFPSEQYYWTNKSRLVWPVDGTQCWFTVPGLTPGRCEFPANPSWRCWDISDHLKVTRDWRWHVSCSEQQQKINRSILGILFQPLCFVHINRAEFIVQTHCCKFQLDFITHDLLLLCGFCYFLALITFWKINLKAFFSSASFFFLPAGMPEALMEHWNQAQTVTPLPEQELQIGQRLSESSGSDRGEMEERR